MSEQPPPPQVSPDGKFYWDGTGGCRCKGRLQHRRVDFPTPPGPMNSECKWHVIVKG